VTEAIYYDLPQITLVGIVLPTARVASYVSLYVI